MIDRYTLPEMGNLWSEENKIKVWLQVELAVIEAMHELKMITDNDLIKIKEGVRLNIDKMKEIERTTQHDVVAFIESISEGIGEEGRYIHLGMTSSDVLDTANAILMKESLKIIKEKVRRLMNVLEEKARETKDLVMIGRTHGVHAEPITMGLKFALWYAEMSRNMERLREATKRIAVGKISGAVGTYSNISPEIEMIACKKLGLEPALISTQIIQRDRYAEYVFILALIATTIEKIALEIRNLQRTETREVEEPFGKGQKGSSAMPHKRNPVKCEQLCGLARVARAYINVAMENQALWHERDISHSSTERIMLPDVSICVDYMLYSITQILSGLIIYPDNIEKNLKLLSGLTYSSGLLTELIRNGLSRKQAYSLVQELAMVGWDKKNFYEEVANDAIVKKYISPELLKKIFSHDYYVRHREYILDRVFKDKIRDE